MRTHRRMFRNAETNGWLGGEDHVVRPGGLAEYERELIRSRTGEDRERGEDGTQARADSPINMQLPTHLSLSDEQGQIL